MRYDTKKIDKFIFSNKKNIINILKILIRHFIQICFELSGHFIQNKKLKK